MPLLRVWRKGYTALRCRECEVERGAFTFSGLSPDGSAMGLDDRFADGKTDARTRNILAVKAFEDAKYAAGVLLFEALSVIADREPQFPFRRSAFTQISGGTCARRYLMELPIRF